MGHRKELPVTHLRKMMLEELQRRHYAHRTAKTYVRIVRDFAQHFHRSPNQLGPGADSSVPSSSVLNEKARASDCVPVHFGALFLLRKNTRQAFLGRASRRTNILITLIAGEIGSTLPEFD
jgi:Phage integrase, N-terminal SAM-like domain